MLTTMAEHTIECANPLGIADELDERGVVCLDNAAPAAWLTQARSEVMDLLGTNGEKDHFVRTPRGEAHSATEAFIASPAVRELLTDIVQERLPRAEADFTGSALRVIAGPRARGDAFWFHYDASVVTMVVPLFVPDDGRGRSGELIGLFNKRPFRRFAVVNIFDKVVGQSRFYRQRLLRRLTRQDGMQTVDMKVGNVYLFWGYRSLHANMPCESGALRATLLLHFGHPHGSSSMLQRAKAIQAKLRTVQTGGRSADEAGASAY